MEECEPGAVIVIEDSSDEPKMTPSQAELSECRLVELPLTKTVVRGPVQSKSNLEV